MPLKAFSQSKQKYLYAPWFQDSVEIRRQYVNDLVCPICKSKMSARGGSRPHDRRTHFFHLSSGKDCPVDRKNRVLTPQEQNHHTLGLLSLYDRLSLLYEEQIKQEGWSIDCEYYDPRIPERVADLAILDENKEVYQIHEFQLTKVPLSQLEERTQSYESLGLETVWWWGKGCEDDEIIQWSLRRFGIANLPILDFSSERKIYDWKNEGRRTESL